jgi:hypothetical protein
MRFDEAPSDTVSRRPWRRWSLLAAAVLVTLFIGAVVGRVTAPASGAPVLVVTQPIAAGAPVTAAQVRLTKMGDAPAGHLVALGGLTGKVARMALQPGQVVTAAVVAPAGTQPSTGISTVGIAVTGGHGPAQPLVVGDRVAVVNVPPNNGDKPLPPHTLVSGAIVAAVAVSHDGTENVSVNVPNAQAVAVAAAAASGQATLVLVK